MTQRNPSHNVHSHGQKQQQSNVQYYSFVHIHSRILSLETPGEPKIVGMGPDNREGPRGAVRIMRMIIGSRGGGLMAAADQRPGASLLQIICDTGAKLC